MYHVLVVELWRTLIDTNYIGDTNIDRLEWKTTYYIHIIKCKTRNNIPKTKHTYIINEYVTSSDHMNNYLFCDVIVLPLLLSLVFTITALHFYTILLYFFVLMSVLIHTVCLSFTLTLCLSFTLRLLIPDDFDNLFIIFLFY